MLAVVFPLTTTVLPTIQMRANKMDQMMTSTTGPRKERRKNRNSPTFLSPASCKRWSTNWRLFEKKTRLVSPSHFDLFSPANLFFIAIVSLNLRSFQYTAKSLIFSQYASTLKWLQTELPKHGFQFRTLSGSMSMQKRAKALHDFQSDPPTTVFLLSMR